MFRSSRACRPFLGAALALVTTAAAGLTAAPEAAATTIAPVTTAPSFVQQVSGRGHGGSQAVSPGSAVSAGDRMVVEVAMWNSPAATASRVTDSAGNGYTELIHFTASDGTELSVWSAPITAGGGTKLTITAQATGTADIGVTALEYAGLSTVGDITAVDQMSHATGTTTSAATVQTPATAPVANGEMAVGFYADSGFGDSLAAGTGFTARVNVSPANDIEMLAEDQPVSAGATPAASVQTGANTIWLMATIVFASAVQTAPQAPVNVSATPGNTTADVTWTAASSGGSPITSYTVTPYSGSTALPPVTVTGSPPTTSANVSGLTNGTPYTFTVSATNAIGTSAPSAPSNQVIPSQQPQGQWSALQTFPIVAISSILMDNGNFIFWDGWQQPEPSVVWNPAAPQTFTTINAPDSVFCDGAAQLPDGRIIVIGGYGGLSTNQLGIVDTNIFNPVTNTWTRVADMHTPRWYPTLTELSDGRYVAISGNSTNATTWADTPEVYDPAANTWTQLSKISTSAVHEDEYPFSYLIPNGNVLNIGPSEDVTDELNVGSQTWTRVGGQSGVVNGSSVQYLPGKILYSGGAALINTATPAQTTTAVLDTTAATPAWRQTSPMLNARIYHTLTMLANGQVLAVGGANTSDQSVITTGVLPTEIWDPVSQTWSAAAPIAAARNYHSTAVLMPDGRVLVAGGGHPTSLADAGQASAQIYSPSYLFNGARPAITSAPSSATYGSTISVSTPDAASIAAVNLVSLGTDTHQMDMNQHFVPLSFTAGSGSLTVTMPSSSAVAPPGHYMLFILNKQGTPSIASIVGLSQPTTPVVPGAPAGVTATAGNGQATVSWTAPSDGNSPITSYTVTPYIGSTAQTPTVISGSPPATTATIGGLTNGTAYTFTVTAANAVGTGPASAASNAVTPSAVTTPAFVQQASTHAAGVSTLTITPSSPLGSGDRLVVEVGAWSSAGAATSGVTDSAGDTFTEVSHFTGPDKTEQSVWTAPITSGAGAKPAITAKLSSAADAAITALEYSGLSSAAGTGAVDQQASASGTTTAAASVSSGATAATGAANELAVGFYSDSGFGDTLTAGSGFTARTNMSGAGDMELLAEDQVVAAGAKPAASVGTGAATVWEMATVVFKSGSQAPPPVPTPPAAPGGVTATAGNQSATVTWSAPANGGSPITSYTVTPYQAGVAQPATQVSGSPPATTAKVTGLTNGTAYTFTVSATNAVGTGPASAASQPVTPTGAAAPSFVQQVSAHGLAKSSISVTMPGNVTTGDRLVVEVADWSSGHATAASVTDSAGDTFTEVATATGSDGTQLSVWTAPVTQSGGTAPVIVAKPTATADMGIAVLEYSGLSTAAGAAAVDQVASGTGTTTSARAVSSGSTPATTAPNELSVGFYADSGFGDTLTADPGYTKRVNVSPAGDIEMFTEDTVVGQGATPAPSVSTGAATIWEMATVVFKAAGG